MLRVARCPRSRSRSTDFSYSASLEEDGLGLVVVVEDLLGGALELEGVLLRVSGTAPSARRSTVAGSLRRRSMRTYRMSLWSNSKSIHEPRYGMMRRCGDLARRVALALVVVEEGARAPVELADDDALGAVDDEGAVLGHQRDFAEVDLLLLHVAD